MTELSVIIPVFNSEITLKQLFDSVSGELKRNSGWEVIFVFDCGNERSWNIVNAIACENPSKVKALRLPVNTGQHNAVLHGIRHSAGRFIVTMDEDLQHNPVYIKKLLEKIKTGGYDVVYARFRELKHSPIRKILSVIFRLTLRLIIPGLYPYYTSYRILKRETAMALLELKVKYHFIDGMMGMVTEKFGYIEAEHYCRTAGESTYTMAKLLRHGLRIIINYNFFMLLWQKHKYRKFNFQ